MTLQQRIFVCKCYFKWEPPSRVRTEHIQTFPGEVPHSRFTVHEIVTKFETTGSVEKRRNRKRTVLTEETLDEICSSLERTPTKPIPKLAQHVVISESSSHRATKLLKLKPYKCTSVHSLKQGDKSSIFYKVRKSKIFFMLFARSLCRRKAGCGTPNHAQAKCRAPVRF